MRRSFLVLAALVAILAGGRPAGAWWDAGHMQIAAVAYKYLTGPAKDRADALLRLNKDYAKWTAGAPDEATAKQWALSMPPPGRMTSR
jgi:hypothetical protein